MCEREKTTFIVKTWQMWFKDHKRQRLKKKSWNVGVKFDEIDKIDFLRLLHCPLNYEARDDTYSVSEREYLKTYTLYGVLFL